MGLEELSLEGTAVGDATLARIGRLPRLRRLRVQDCPAVTDDAVLRLAEARPGLRIDVLE